MSDSEVPANCVELCLERIQDQYPRYLRGGNKPTCLRSLCSDSLEQQLGELKWKLSGDPTVLVTSFFSLLFFLGSSLSLTFLDNNL